MNNTKWNNVVLVGDGHKFSYSRPAGKSSSIFCIKLFHHVGTM